MRFRSEADLRDVYRPASQGALDKVIGHLDDHCADFLAKSPFFVLSTSAASGAADGSPKGGEPGFVQRLDEQRLAWADLSGNNRLDSFTNLVENPGVALLFLIPGMQETLRVNGTAELTADPALCERFAVNGKPAKLVAVVTVAEAYIHCNKASRRSGLWEPESWLPADERPRAACILRDHAAADIDADLLDDLLEADAAATMWEPGGDTA